jgi:hypothetical protein
MPLEVRSTPPASIIQGDTLTWRLTSRDASPSEASLRVRVSSASHTLEVTGTTDGDGWLIAVTPEQTTRLGCGLLKWLARAVYTSGAVQTIDAGTITAVPLTALGTGASTESHAARLVALLEAQLERLAADSLAEYSLGERTAKRRALAEVEASLAKARRQLAMEQNGGRLPRVQIVNRPLAGFRPLSS